MSENIIKAIRFATEAHKGQKRKGSKVPYITHPLTVGLILARYGAPRGVVIAGILHDTMEDCGITRGQLERKFSKEIAHVVEEVSNLEPYDNYQTRTENLLRKVKTYSFWAVLVRSADMIANGMDILADHEEIGDKVFLKFKGTKEEVIHRYAEMILALKKQYETSDMNEELHYLGRDMIRLLDGNSVDKN